MRLVIADTGPINYLVQIGRIEVLPCLFARIALPDAVQSELSHPLAPTSVREWIGNPPSWLEIHETSRLLPTAGLDEGESAAIALALSLNADIVLLDDREGVRVAARSGLRVTGTLGVLDLAAERGLIVFSDSIRELERTTFRRPAALLQLLLDKHG